MRPLYSEPAHLPQYIGTGRVLETVLEVVRGAPQQVPIRPLEGPQSPSQALSDLRPALFPVVRTVGQPGAAEAENGKGWLAGALTMGAPDDDT